MVKIVVNEDCGNSPRKSFLKDLNIAFAEGNISFVSDHVTEEIVWNIVGDKVVIGKREFVTALHEMVKTPAKELHISKIITHGYDASANGYIVLKNGSHYNFCDVYEFSGAKGTLIKGITSYVIEQPKSKQPLN